MQNINNIISKLNISLESKHISLIQHALNLGLEIRITGPSKKTLHVFFNDKSYGYINTTILSKDCVLGYYFNAFDHPYPHAPERIKKNPLRSLCDRYKASVDHFNVHIGTGSNSGRVFVGIVDLNIAKNIISMDTNGV